MGSVVQLRQPSLSEVIGRHVRLRKLGREMVGKSPFLDVDDDESLVVSDKLGKWRCFGSDKQGGLTEWCIAIQKEEVRHENNRSS